MSVKFESDNLIYNRYDLIHKDKYCEYIIRDLGNEYKIQVICNDDKAFVNVWGKEFPEEIFDKLVEHVFEDNHRINKIEVRAGGNNYRNQLSVGGDICITLEGNKGALWSSLGQKVRYNLRRNVRSLKDKYGELELRLNHKPIKEEVVAEYFDWKLKTHGRDYGLSPTEYIEKYYVTDALILRAGDNDISIILYCLNEDTVYVENLSYNLECEKYSPGILVYAAFLEQMEKQGVKYIFLGNAGLDYKKRFGSVEYKRYYGNIYRKEVFERINRYFHNNDIKSAAIYGLGNMARRFWAYYPDLDVDLLYGIDRNADSFETVKVYRPSELDKAPSVDMIIITLGDPDKEVEQVIDNYGYKKIYIEELMEKIGCGHDNELRK